MSECLCFNGSTSMIRDSTIRVSGSVCGIFTDINIKAPWMRWGYVYSLANKYRYNPEKRRLYDGL